MLHGAGVFTGLRLGTCWGSVQSAISALPGEPAGTHILLKEESRLPTSLLLVPEELPSAKGASLPYTVLYTKWSKRVVYVLLNEKSLMRELKILNGMLGIQKISETFWKIDYFHGRYTQLYFLSHLLTIKRRKLPFFSLENTGNEQ